LIDGIERIRSFLRFSDKYSRIDLCGWAHDGQSSLTVLVVLGAGH